MKKIKMAAFLLAVVFGGSFGILPVYPQEVPDPNKNKEELESLIRQKSEDLKKINEQMEETKQNLESTRTEGRSLERELTSMQRNIEQLQLGIRSDELTNQKLGLEIESLHYDISDIQESIVHKREAVARVLSELQKKDDTNAFIEMLKSQSIAEGLKEAQALENLRGQLSLDIANLTELNQRLNETVGDVSAKKDEIENRKKNSIVKKSLIEDQKEERKVVLAVTKSKESLYEQQLNELKKQQDEIEDEISNIEEKLKEEFNSDLLPSSKTKFGWPALLVSQGGKGRITQNFGEKSYLYRYKPHNGLDIGVPVGTPVYAAESGTVMAVDNNDRSAWQKYQYGRYVLIEHENNLATLYAHLSKQVVSRGERVKKGQVIGYSGNTGYSTGAHLHFGLYWAPSIQLKSVSPAAGLVPVGVVINPQDYL